MFLPREEWCTCGHTLDLHRGERIKCVRCKCADYEPAQVDWWLGMRGDERAEWIQSYYYTVKGGG